MKPGTLSNYCKDEFKYENQSLECSKFMRRKLTQQSLLHGDVIIVNIGVGYQDPRQENSDTINGVPWNHNRMSQLFRVNLGGIANHFYI